MITIIPNWHPILVHFSIGLLSISVLFYFAEKLLPNNHAWKQQWLHMANWSLWTGCILTILTLIAGWYAYNTVAHDSVSHQAMTLHRNWAIPTACLFFLLALFSINLTKKNERTNSAFLSLSAIALISLMVTGWLGAEAVYRHGLGVMSLPTVEEGADGHNHSHHSPHKVQAEISNMQPAHPHEKEQAHDDSPTDSHHEHDVNSHDNNHHH